MFLDELKQRDVLIDTFDEKLWHSSVENITVNTKEKAVVKFKNDSEITI